MTTVTLYIPSRNYGVFLKDCLESVSRQLYRDFEVFLIDEASEDNSVEIFRSFKEKEKTIPVRIIENSRPIGLQRIANKIIAIANGRYIMRLDADDMLTESALLSLVEKADRAENKNNVFVTGDYFVCDSVGRVTGYQGHRTGWSETRLFDELAPHGACALASVRLMKATGGYSTDFNAQDGWDIWTKIQHRCEHLHLSSPVFLYRQHGGSMSKARERILNERRKIISSRSSIRRGGYKPSLSFLIAAKSIYPGQQGIPLLTYGNQTLVQRCMQSLDDTGFKYNAWYITDDSNVKEHFCKEFPHVKALEVDDERLATLLGQQAPPINEYLDLMSKQEGVWKGDICCFINLHSIGRTSKHLVDAVDQLTDGSADVLYSVERVKDILFEGDANELKPFYYGRYKSFSNADSYILSFNGAFVMGWTDGLSTKERNGEIRRITGYEMTAKESARYISDLALRVDLSSLRLK